MVLGLLLSLNVNADDIKDFQIEGISIGDSLLKYYSEKDIKKVVRSVANSKINETYALAKLKIIDLANNGDKNAVKTFVKRYRKNTSTA